MHDKALELKPGTAIRLETTQAGTLVGRLAQVSDDAITIRRFSGREIEALIIPWAEVQSISSPNAEDYAALPVVQKAAQTSAGTPVEIRLIDNTKLRGRMGDISNTGVMLQVVTDNKLEQREIPFSESKSLRPRSMHSAKKAWIIIGTSVAAFFAILAIIFRNYD